MCVNKIASFRQGKLTLPDCGTRACQCFQTCKQNTNIVFRHYVTELGTETVAETVSTFVSTSIFKLLQGPLNTHLPQPAALGVVGGKANKSAEKVKCVCVCVCSED